MLRVLPDGNLDTSFDIDGQRGETFGASVDCFRALAPAAAHKVVAAGYTDNGANFDYALARYLSN
jgi:hypothetical protein